jgi:hypothetical protein
MKILRVFPRRLKATPEDNLVWIGYPNLFPPEADECHISVTFTWDLSKVEMVAESWSRILPTEIGGPATGQKGEEFIPGMYLRKGYVITSRGCPNRCWFCDVWKRDGDVRELPITEGWNVLDDNLLACSEKHIRSVFAMLSKQTNPVEFTGGIEPARLRDWHLFVDLKPQQIFFAYDSPDDEEPCKVAMDKMVMAGFTRNVLRCFVLIGYKGDTFEMAEKRLRSVCSMGAYPMAMLWRDVDGKRDLEWSKFQRLWARPASIYRLVNG